MAGAIARALKEFNPGYQVQLQGGWMLPDAIAQAVVQYIQENGAVTGVAVNPQTGAQLPDNEGTIE